MAKKKNIQSSLSAWAYQSRKSGNKTGDILKSVGEVEKVLSTVKKKKQ